MMPRQTITPSFYENLNLFLMRINRKQPVRYCTLGLGVYFLNKSLNQFCFKYLLLFTIKDQFWRKGDSKRSVAICL